MSLVDRFMGSKSDKWRATRYTSPSLKRGRLTGRIIALAKPAEGHVEFRRSRKGKKARIGGRWVRATGPQSYDACSPNQLLARARIERRLGGEP